MHRFNAVLLMTLIGCKDSYNLTKIQTKMWVSPQMSDVGSVFVEEPHVLSLQIDCLQGDPLDILGVEVTNVTGEYFSFDGELPQDIPSGESAMIDINYLPSDIGYHLADVEVMSSSVEGSLLVGVRGHAVLPEASRWPNVMDFGNVDPGSSKTLQLSIINDSAADLTLNELGFGEAVFSTTSTLPTVIPAESEVLFDVVFSPDDDTGYESTLSMDFGSILALQDVVLRGNACEGGDPVFYDIDQDGYTTCGGDCDDDLDSANPAGLETCNGVDNDCNGLIDDGTECYDDDGDGFSENDGDCNDYNIDIAPDLEEVPENGIDDNCDGTIDGGAQDADEDGYTPEGGDCDDTNFDVYPNAPESADGIDNDCDGVVDEGTEVFDDDGDGYSESQGDCNDARADISPAEPELADWLDNDCDGTVDEGTTNYDDDGDGYSELGGDCDDSDFNVNPSQVEIDGDNIDNNCDGVTQ